jgi:hypothetical protein
MTAGMRIDMHQITLTIAALLTLKRRADKPETHSPHFNAGGYCFIIPRTSLIAKFLKCSNAIHNMVKPSSSPALGNEHKTHAHTTTNKGGRKRKWRQCEASAASAPEDRLSSGRNRGSFSPSLFRARALSEILFLSF